MKKSKVAAKKREVTKEKILKAAKAVFAETGFKNANIEEIAKRAKVDRASVYYYIGDKQEVYSEVIAGSLNKIIENLIQDAAAEQSPEEKLRQYIKNWVPNKGRDLNDNMIYFWEFATGGKNITPAYRENFSKLIEIFLDIIDEGVKAGDFKPVNPYILHMMISGALMMWSTVNAPKSNLVSERFLEKYNQHLTIDMAEEIEWLVLQLIKKP
ncbi:MAG: TetR/AcrR family transcriptional regulator [Proteobacteria bacterium]|nr:TetR/AcrR family transcriptional regulator [Pseudomonadota bacterium]